MSEEILKALTQLFAIISKQDGGVSDSVRNYVIGFFEKELDRKSVAEYITLYDQYAQDDVQEEEDGKKKKKSSLVNVRDSVRTLKLCKGINKTLTQQQKVIVLFKLLEMLSADGEFSEKRMEIIQTASDVFRIPKDEYAIIESFAKAVDAESIMDSDCILLFDEQRPPEGSLKKFIDSGDLDGEIIFVKVSSVNLYFTKYTGKDEIFLNGQLVKKNSFLLFSHGSVFKTPKGAPLYYSDLVTRYNIDQDTNKISFQVKDLEFRFPNGAIGLRNINISEGSGKLIGIMGASGAGKTTLLNTLAGLEYPSAGQVLINGRNLHTEKDKIEGVIGYVAQDDLLIEDLTVFQNLYYNAKLCFKDSPDEKIVEKVNEVLQSLGLDRISALKVGSVLNKKISGGQRKRLNIALELIREPGVMFVDEPTSGLSSRDSENVIDLLKELSLKGKLIFVVIHQPSSDIYKMFDKMFIMDTGGFPVFYGNPVEAVMYFKKATNQVGSDKGQCTTCGNVNPELIFNIIEARVVDEYGELTSKRKIRPEEWHEIYNQNFKVEEVEQINEAPPKNLKIPSKLNQAIIFTTRDFLSKISNRMYMFINLLEAPFLALLLAFIVRYKNSAQIDEYVFRYNDNIPAYIFISIIVSLFMGLTVSAEEIISDRKILKREAFLNLSRFSYLSSKLLILFTLSAIQTCSFVLIGNFILEIHDLNLMYWFVLFSISCFANMLGLNISASLDSAVTVYIMIPLLLIPQMILSGAIFRFDQLNDAISEKGRVPFVADFMASRWAYEALAVEQFKSNPYEKLFFDVEMEESMNNYRVSYWLDRMDNIIERCLQYQTQKNDSTRALLEADVVLLKNELAANRMGEFLQDVDVIELLNASDFNKEMAQSLRDYLELVGSEYNDKFNISTERKDSITYAFEEGNILGMSLVQFESMHHNERLAEVVKNSTIKDKIIEDHIHGRLIQQIDPVFNDPVKNHLVRGYFDYRTHFYSPNKHFMGRFYGTLGFNMSVVWFMSFILSFTLYFESFRKIFDIVGKLSDKYLHR